MNETTLEQYFIEDYKRLKSRNEILAEELRKYEMNAGNHEYGITDLHQRCKAVRGQVISSYYVNNRLKDGYLKEDKVREWVELPDAELFGEVNGKTAQYTTILEFKEHEFQYTLAVKESRTEWIAVSDGKRDSSLIELEKGDFCENTWFSAERGDEFKSWLLDLLRDELGEGLERYESEKEKEGGK